MKFASGSGFQNSDMFKDYQGISGMMEFTRRLTECDFANFVPLIVSLGKDKVLVEASYKPTVFASGRSSGLLIDLMEWKVSKGKVSSVSISIPAMKTMDALFLSEREASEIVMSWLTAWEAGKFADANSKIGRETFKTLMDENVTFIADAAMENTSGYKTYTGESEFFEWVKFLSGMDFPDFTVVGMKMLGGSLMKEISYTPTVKATGKTGPKVYDIISWSFTGGKISKVRHFWVNPAALDSLFAE